MPVNHANINIILDLSRILEDSAKVIYWLTTANLNLGGVAPLDLMLTGRSRKVEEFIADAVME